MAHPPLIGRVSAVVKWADDYNAGCQFDDQVSSDVIQALLADKAPSATPQPQDRDNLMVSGCCRTRACFYYLLGELQIKMGAKRGRTLVVDRGVQLPQCPTMREREGRTIADLVEGLWHLRALAIQLDLKVVGALIKAAIGVIPTTLH